MPDGIPRALKLMDEWGIDGVVNLSGMYPGPPRHMLETQLAAAAETHGRMIVFANADFRLVRARPDDYGKLMAEELVESKRLGARGLKIPKGLGLGYPAPDGKHLLPIDDKGLDPLFEKAGALGMPIAIHIGDPKAFWKPRHARQRALGRAAGPPRVVVLRPADVPPWQELYDAFERRVARHPKTTFIAVHFGNDPEDPDQRRADARQVPELLHRHGGARARDGPPRRREQMRAFFEKYQDRILFGTDTGVGATADDMMFGSNGAAAADARRRGALLQADVALLRDQRQAVREPDADPGPLEDRRHRPARRRSCARSTSRTPSRVLGWRPNQAP